MELNKAQALCIELMNQHGLTKENGWKFEWIKSKRAAGMCGFFGTRKEYYGGVIMLSSFVTLHHSDEKVKDTILHEIAHGLTPGHGHDYVWRMKAMSIGCNGHRCYDVNESEALVEAHEKTANVIGTCPKCSKKSFKTRMPKRDLWCKCTNRRFLQEEKIVFVLNNAKNTLPKPAQKVIPTPKVPIAASRSFQQFTKQFNGHTSFPNTLLNQAPDSYKGMLDKFEKEFLALPAMMNETRQTFENIVANAKKSNSWRTMNREVRKACNAWIVKNGYMTNKAFQEMFFYEGVMIGRVKYGKEASWISKGAAEYNI